MRILLIEDDKLTADFILQGLQQAGFSTCHASDGEEGLFKVKTEPFDLAVIDIMLPKRNGISVIEEMRFARIGIPVIVLSARGSVDDKVQGLRAGGDDYLVKPFSFTELLARIQAQLRRSAPFSEPTVLTVADLSIDLLSRRVTRGGVRIDLQPREFALLEYLVRNTGRVVSKTMIMEHVWEYNFDPQSNIVEARMYSLRDKIDKPFDRELIHTIRGVGYVLE